MLTVILIFVCTIWDFLFHHFAWTWFSFK